MLSGVPGANENPGNLNIPGEQDPKGDIHKEYFLNPILL
jgi:hypothetical protein